MSVTVTGVLASETAGNASAPASASPCYSVITVLVLAVALSYLGSCKMSEQALDIHKPRHLVSKHHLPHQCV